MGRLSGSHLLGTTILASMLILAICDRKTESAPRQLPNSDSVLVSEHGAGWPTESLQQKPRCLYRTALQPTQAVLSNLRRGTRIVVGSLDVSGSRHTIVLANSINDVGSAESLSVCRYSMRDFPQVGRSLSLPSTMRYCTEQIPDLPSQIQTNSSIRRIFLTPHFCDATTVHEPTECEMISESTRIRVFLDRRGPESTDIESLISTSEQLISAAESRALPIVEAWIGPIHDIDHDQKLSVVITDLDQRTEQSQQSSPIFGCIREGDFEADASFRGDIIYVDASILELPPNEQAAIFTHELTHAAVCSLQSQEAWESASPIAKPSVQTASHRIPSWLNEAIAHFMELQCSRTASQNSTPSENLQRRIDEFLANSARCPIVADEHVMSREERRSGCRAAATLFLAPWLSSPDMIHRFLHSEDALDRRIEGLTSRHFADVFREWTLSLAATSAETLPLRPDIISADFDHEQYSLPGTAFRCFECSGDVASIVIRSDASTRLQISVIEPIDDTPAAAAANTYTSESR